MFCQFGRSSDLQRSYLPVHFHVIPIAVSEAWIIGSNNYTARTSFLFIPDRFSDLVNCEAHIFVPEKLSGKWRSRKRCWGAAWRGGPNKICCRQQWLLLRKRRMEMLGLLSSTHLSARLQAEKLWYFLAVLGSLQWYIGELIKIISSPINAMLVPWYCDAN